MSDVRVCDGPSCTVVRALDDIDVSQLGDLRAQDFIMVEVPGRIEGPLTFHSEECLRRYYQEQS